MEGLYLSFCPSFPASMDPGEQGDLENRQDVSLQGVEVDSSGLDDGF